jgi:hypothetical protein
MAISIEELKRQRDHIKKHLDWLDARIREADTSSEGPASTSDPEETVPPTQAAPATAQPAAAKPLEEVDTSKFKEKTAQDLRRAKIGCVMIFVLATALFLFLLFGLPYLL